MLGWGTIEAEHTLFFVRTRFPSRAAHQSTSSADRAALLVVAVVGVWQREMRDRQSAERVSGGGHGSCAIF